LKEALAHYRALANEQGAMRSPVLDEQIQKIELTLERVRWLPAKLSSPPIFVNIPQFKLFAFRTTDDFAQDILQMDVIVGAAFDQRQTPVFAADLRYVVIRPYWDVPMSIMRKEYLKLMRANPRWVDVNGYEIVQGQTDNAIIQPATPENIELLAKGVFRLRQKPGPNNALGIVKFMLPNPHNVYLHDTPAQSLFKKSRRAFSHGCIRVANPVGLLAHVLRNDPAWPSERIEAALHSEQTQRIPLKQPIPVFIIYGTAMATEAGPTLFFEDIYHHDARLQAALSARTLQLASLRP
jgi:murein L,D-transpeptidase YcbB/YkuD